MPRYYLLSCNGDGNDMDLFINLPVLLAVALFIGIVTLVKILLSPESGLERRSRNERRSGAPMPTLPFYDLNHQQVINDRRQIVSPDRRKRVFIITTENRRAKLTRGSWG